MAIASLTSIPSRFERLTPVLKSLLQQTVPFEKIILWIPHTYKKREFNEFSLPIPPEGVEIRRCTVDYGPATKILPACESGSTITPDQQVIYCDDDVIYPPHWAASLIAESKKFPESAITNIGTYVDIVIHRHDHPQKGHGLFSRLAQQIARRKFKQKERVLIQHLNACRDTVDIAKGFGGVLVKSKFFSEKVFAIPADFWAVDDIWISGQLAVNNVSIKSLASPVKTSTDENARIDALIDLEVDSRRRQHLDFECVRYFQNQFSIWQSTRL